MDDQEREYIRQFLDNHERVERNWHRARNWLIVACIILVITCGAFFQKWQEERTFRVVVQALVEYYKQDSNHYQELYYDTLSQYNECQRAQNYTIPQLEK